MDKVFKPIDSLFCPICFMRLKYFLYNAYEIEDQ
jgi:hypothetical protein